MKLSKCRWCSCTEFVKVSVTDYPQSLKYEFEYKCADCRGHKSWVRWPEGSGPKPATIKRPASRKPLARRAGPGEGA